MAVRRLGPDDHELLQTLRLQSLRDAPSAFGSTYEREVGFTTEVWRHRLRPDGHVHFIGEAVDGTASGLVVVGPDEKESSVAWLLAMWVAPAARGTGLADELIDTAIRTAAGEGCSIMRLHVADGNDRAERVYVRHGFARTGRSFVRPRDNQVEVQMERSLAVGE
jgi:ribosomal protein S18 acetylase RimI-like enzyme